MKSFRKSANKDSIRSQISTPLPLPGVSKPPSSILPPQKVIRALTTQRPRAAQELAFKKGDFFYVNGDVTGPDGLPWYEAHNPATGARGLVPCAMFEEFTKPSNISRMSQMGNDGFSPNSSPKVSTDQPPMPSRKSGTQIFYAVVQHDFVAERADELDAKRGDSVTVVAQSNREWFVAKPIGRLGRPGLIPVSFVEVHDPTTGKPIQDVQVLMDSGVVPRVEDWKKKMYSYKQNSIALGVLDGPLARQSQSVPSTPYGHPQPPTQLPQPHHENGSHHPRHQSQPSQSQRDNYFPSSPPTQYPDDPPQEPEVAPVDPLPEGLLLKAECVSFHFEMEEYWFRVDAIFQPYPRPGSNSLPPAKQLVLFRVYNDFYDFQVGLLAAFPREAGREGDERVLPFMPGPAAHVDNELTQTRREELNEYLHQLCGLSTVGARHVVEHVSVREFLALKPGDVESEQEPRYDELEEIDSYRQNDYDINDQMQRLRVDDQYAQDDYDDGYASQSQRAVPDRHQSSQQQRHPYAQRTPSSDNLRMYAHVQNHQRNGSQSSLGRHHPDSRATSPTLEGGQSHTQPMKWSGSSSTAASSRRSEGSSGTRSRSQSVAASTAPPISAGNPSPAFIKIKIFDRISDDLVAIRVHPQVSLVELTQKIEARLGGDVQVLHYRADQQDITINSDDELRAWVESTDKYVLYAD
ncbi:hypothetical protein BD626DRAFT_425338 [Schizophyllum amplum]|uniref:SH3 domain-containing protein n=1 Tax=Schizophyllum amplum TaxID=97359 RepID=A0A550CUK4_9AGAR|nr:hypothetical protein BD626DRAFT_425338 [Auriculariopsis ampla]